MRDHPTPYLYGERIVVHPNGLPPGKGESGLTDERAEEARKAAASHYGEEITDPSVIRVCKKTDGYHCKHVINSNRVIHLDAKSLALLEVFPLQ